MKSTFVLLLLFIASTLCLNLSKKVQEKIFKSGEASVFINFKNQVDFKALEKSKMIKLDRMEESARGKLVVNTLKEHAKVQIPMIKYLKEKSIKHHSYYITNTIHLPKANLELLLKLKSFSEVASIELVDTIKIDEKPKKYLSKEEAKKQLKNRIEAGVSWVNAPGVWEKGHKGKGITIGVIDTGAFLHDDLKNFYRGRDGNHAASWLDTINNRPEPYDDNMHGTHCHGTVTGHGEDITVGVAPEAEWISCKFLSAAGSGTYDNAVRCMEFMLAPNGQSDLRPHVVSNSYGGGGYTAAVDQALSALLAAGVEMVYAAGNNAICNGVSQPAILPQALSVAALQRNSDWVAYYSSGGPGNDDQLKPEISAPGSGVLSTSNRGGYVSADGTSMACPHVAGAIALLWSANAQLKRNIEETRQIFYRTAKGQVPWGWQFRCSSRQPTPNNVYGYGTVDCLKAVEFSSVQNQFKILKK